MSKSLIVAAVRAAAARRPDSVALVSPRETVSYAELESRAAGVAAALARVGDSAIGLLHPNSPGFVSGLLGALWAGKTVALLPFIAPPPVLKLMAAAAGVRSVLASPELAPRAAEAGLEVLAADSSAASSGTLPPLAPLAQQEAVLIYTSGTTGMPKAVALSESNMLANVEGCRLAGPFSGDDVMLAILPLFHAFGLTVTVLLPLTLGGKIVLEDRFVPRTSLQSVAAHRVTAMIGVPGQFRLLAKEKETLDVDAASLRLCISGAERLGHHTEEAFQQSFARPLLQGYGATEASPVVAFNRPSHNRSGSVGLPLPNSRVTIREDSRVLPVGEQGEVCMEGPSVMLGYFRQPEATAKKAPGGVLHTGDRGWLDADGYLHLAGRHDDMIKIAGEKVYPSEIERALEQVPGLEEAAVIGVTGESGETVLAAFVAPSAGAILHDAAVRVAARNLVGAAKAPKTVTVLAQLPRTPAGKVDKKALAKP